MDTDTEPKADPPAETPEPEAPAAAEPAAESAPPETPAAESAPPETPAAEAAPEPAAEEKPAAEPAPAEEVKPAASDGDGAAEEPAPKKKEDATTAAARMLAEDLGEKEEKPEFVEKVVFINRCAKVVKGGRRFSFSALVVSGDREGKVGYGFGKANEVAESIRKASDASRKNMIKVCVQENTIPHDVVGEFGGGKVLLRPASPGTGIIAGGGVRAVIEAAGIKDVLGKSLGSNNHANVVKATLEALRSLRGRDEIYSLRGKKTRARKAL